MSGVAILMAVMRSRFAGDKQLMGTDAKKLTGLLRRALISPNPSVGIELLLYFIEIPAPIELKARVFIKIFNSSGHYYGTLDAVLCHSVLVKIVCEKLGWPRIPISKYNFNHGAGLSGDLEEAIGFSKERVRAIGKRLYKRFIECEWIEDKMVAVLITWLNDISLSPTERAVGLWVNLNRLERSIMELHFEM